MNIATTITKDKHLERKIYAKEDMPMLSDKDYKGEQRPWNEKKRMSLGVAQDLRAYADHNSIKEARHLSDKIDDCGNYIEFANLPINGKNHKWVTKGCFCSKRVCPLCMWRQSHENASILRQVYDESKARFKSYKWRFLTLTVPNCNKEDLSNVMDRMFDAWNKFTQRKEWLHGVAGAVRKLEIEYNAENDTYHPHIHVLMLVPFGASVPSRNRYVYRCKETHAKRVQDIYDGNPVKGIRSTDREDTIAKYASMGVIVNGKVVSDALPMGWLEIWQDCYGDTGITQVDIRKADENSIPEMAKYMTKTAKLSEKIKDPVLRGEVIYTIAQVTHGRRLYVFSKLLNEIKQEIVGNDDTEQTYSSKPRLVEDKSTGEKHLEVMMTSENGDSILHNINYAKLCI